ncbi:RNA-binding protein [Peptoniphilus catoniae]|uniref:YlmH family RNA-binding protein n=1 Tax=Peptoniphilus catoniae TaxID=1660341 RepID=UPI0010FF40E1|nr:YlmH/Sll1252 family protein [Peptoniphilus catoniae]
MKLNKEDLLGYITDESKILSARRVIDKIEIAANRHISVSTDFLDPYEIEIAKSILNRFSEISYEINGGYSNAERQVIYIYPSYLCGIDKNDISVLSYESNFKINHKDILGALMGLGIDRNKVGDIVVDDSFFYIFIRKELFDFVKTNLEKVSRYNIKYKYREFIEPELQYLNKVIIISSLRLDVFLSSALNLSRSNVSEFIKSDKVKVNFKMENKISFNVKEGDLISVKKFGRIYFDEIIGRSKKDKYIVKIKIPK